MSNDPDDNEISVERMHAGFQRVRPTEELAGLVAADVEQGATVVSAAAKYGISRSKLMRWLDWGMEADANGAGPEDTHAPYLDFFLAVLQAQGIAGVRAQRAAFTYHTQWWIQNHPETRAEFGGEASGQLLLAEPAPATVEGEVVDPSLDESTMRTVLQTLIESGAAAASRNEPHIVEAEPLADILDDDDTERQVS